MPTFPVTVSTSLGSEETQLNPDIGTQQLDEVSACANGDQVHVVWTEQQGERMWWVNSYDGGETWLEPTFIPSTLTLLGPAAKVVTHCQADGLVLAWQEELADSQQIRLVRSFDRVSLDEIKLPATRTVDIVDIRLDVTGGQVVVAWTIAKGLFKPDKTFAPTEELLTLSSKEGWSSDPKRALSDDGLSALQLEDVLMLAEGPDQLVVAMRHVGTGLDVLTTRSTLGEPFSDAVALNTHAEVSKSDRLAACKLNERVATVWSMVANEVIVARQSHDFGETWTEAPLAVGKARRAYQSETRVACAWDEDLLHVIWQENQPESGVVHAVVGMNVVEGGQSLLGAGVSPQLMRNDDAVVATWKNENAHQFFFSSRNPGPREPRALEVDWLADEDPLEYQLVLGTDAIHLITWSPDADGLYHRAEPL